MSDLIHATFLISSLQGYGKTVFIMSDALFTNTRLQLYGDEQI